MSGDSTGASIEDPSEQISSCNVDDGPGVWYSFQVDKAGSLLLEVGDDGFDAQIALFSGECTSLTCLAEIDDQVSEKTEQLLFGVEAGIQYYVVVSGDDVGDRGTFSLIVDFNVPPENDICSNAVAVSPANLMLSSNPITLIGGNRGASIEDPSEQISACNVEDGPGVWYSFIVAQDGIIQLQLDDDGFDAQIALFSGGCTSLTCLAETDEEGSEDTEQLHSTECQLSLQK